MISAVAIAFTACGGGSSSGGTSAYTPTSLTIEHASAPVDVDVSGPRLSWQLPTGFQSQSAYQIRVATSATLLSSGAPDIWDSGKVSSSSQTDVTYAGATLLSNTTYYWTMRAWDEAGRTTPWAATATFETGFLSQADWTGKWIGRDAQAATYTALLRKSFTLPQGVTRARLRLAVAGLYVAYVNGERLGDQVHDPAPTQYDKTALYATFDVTSLLQEGENVLGVELGRGRYGNDAMFTASTTQPRLLGQLDLTYTDGTTAQIITDDTWQLSDGPRTDSFMTGEVYDARLEQDGWNDVGFDATAWATAPVQVSPSATVLAEAMEPVKVTETVQPISTAILSSTERVYDFGKTMAGWAQIQALGTAGITLKISYGETLNSNGTVNTDRRTTYDEYTLKGVSEPNAEIYEPSFTWRGFRYVQVEVISTDTGTTDWPTELRVAAQMVHNAVDSTGEFRSSSDLLNWIHAAMRATVLNNLIGIPLDGAFGDCYGWTADTGLYLDAAVLNFGMQRFYEQWQRSFRQSQSSAGALPAIAPRWEGTAQAFGGTNDPSWGGMLVQNTWSLYQYYGDKQILTDNYDALAAYANLIIANLQDGIYPAEFDLTRLFSGNLVFSFGDWVAPGAETGGWQNPPEGSMLTANADTYLEFTEIAKIATALGKTDDANKYQAAADSLATAFNAKFLDTANGIYKTTISTPYRQTSNIFPLFLKIVPSANKSTVLANLIDNIETVWPGGAHLNTGTTGTKRLFPALTDEGYGDVAFAIATQTSYPSYGYWRSQGATTMWESWDRPPSLPRLSEDHPFFGTIDDWFFQYLGGVTPAAAGYTAVQVKPFVPTSGLDSAGATIATPRGQVASDWEIANGQLTLTVTIPGNTTASVYVPVTTADAKVSVTATSGNAKFVATASGYAQYTVSSGTFVFTTAR